MFQVVTSGLLDPMSSPAPEPQVAGSPADSSVAAQDVPASALTPEEEFDLFGPPDNQNPFVGAANSGAASAAQSLVAKASVPESCLIASPALGCELPWNRRRTSGPFRKSCKRPSMVWSHSSSTASTAPRSRSASWPRTRKPAEWEARCDAQTKNLGELMGLDNQKLSVVV